MIGRTAGQRWHPGIHSMAVITFQRCLNMRRTFAGGNHVIMTTGADTQHFSMIDRAGRYR